MADAIDDASGLPEVTNGPDLSKWKGCQRPAPAILKGSYAILENYRNAKHAEPLWQALGELETNHLIRYFPNGPFANAEQFGEWLVAENETGNFYTMVISSVKTGEVTGMANYMRITPAHGSIEVGAVAHGPKMARSPIATDTHYLMAKHIFEELGYRRYEWKLNNENEASHKAAIRLGFAFEGTFRNHMVAKGKNRDTAWYSMLESEWPMVKAAMESWLAPENFDKEGGQLRTLETIRTELKQKFGHPIANIKND